MKKDNRLLDDLDGEFEKKLVDSVAIGLYGADLMPPMSDTVKNLGLKVDDNIDKADFYEAEDIGPIAPGERFGRFTVRDVNRHESGAIRLDMSPNSESNVQGLFKPANPVKVDKYGFPKGMDSDSEPVEPLDNEIRWMPNETIPTQYKYAHEHEGVDKRVHGDLGNELADKILNPVNVNLFGEPELVRERPLTPEECYPVLMGQAILDIKALTGKREKAAKEALKAATVAMLDQASTDCFFIRGNTASSKNSKEIGFYFKKNPKTGKNDKVNILVDSDVTKKYRKATAGQWLQNKVEFLNQTRDLAIPLMIEFTFIRDSMRTFDFINAAQICCDLMKDNGWVPDDDTVHICPVFNPCVYYAPELAGVLIRVIK